MSILAHLTCCVDLIPGHYHNNWGSPVKVFRVSGGVRCPRLVEGQPAMGCRVINRTTIQGGHEMDRTTCTGVQSLTWREHLALGRLGGDNEPSQDILYRCFSEFRRHHKVSQICSTGV